MVSKQFSGLRFMEDIKNATVYDSNNVKLGRVLDCLVKQTEEGVDLTKFTIGGSYWEELLEDMGLKPDVDPVFGVEVIESVAPKSIKLSVPGEELKSTTIDPDAIDADEFKLSHLSDIQLVDSNDEPLGNIIDIKFAGGHFQFVLGDGSWKEMLEDLGLREDIDFLISPKFVNSFDQKVLKLSQGKADLTVLFKENIKPEYRKAGELEKAKLQANALNAFYPMR
ncbi:MAG: hypothetical protein INQ03_08775 [Candidatus Heimdallarchaeota archaeon]|nr:hypothetical protein [Candidatus Heimdallarchaeota archaeon]